MSFWKVLGGAAAGVATIVALPVAGPIGAVTAVGAAVAAGVGAAAGSVAAAVDDSEEQAHDAGYRQGQKETKAEHSLELKRLESKLEVALNKFDDMKKHYNAIIAMEAVAIACANCDGHIDESEREQIDEFINGISHFALPSDVKERIMMIYHSPLGLKESFELANRSEIPFDIYDEIIDIVMHADGVIHEQEEVFRQAWNNLKAA